MSSFIETPKRPATQEVRQAQPVIHVTTVRSSGCLPSLVGSVLVLGGIAFAASQLFGGFSQLTSRVTGATSGKPFNLPFPLPSAISLPQPLAEVDIFKDPSLVKRRFEERLGKPVMVKELVLYPSYAIAEAQDPANKQHLDRYVYRSGAFDKPDPVRLFGGERDVNKVVFPLDQIDFDKLAGMIQSAPKELPNVEESKVTHVILTRDVFTKGVPAVRVYVSGPRDSGYVEYDAKGKRGRVVH
ncbi:MAG TPA: hypothetical protein VFQ35_06675 [Polyangiaceae bacterium]|nr:hypothetical protein [Polyangiaceae bacterium]